MRRIVLAAGASVLAAGLLSACTGSSGGHAASSSGSPAGASAPAGSTAAVASGTTGSTGAPSSSAATSGAAGHVTGPSGGPVPPGFTPTSVTFASGTEAWVLGTAPCSSPPCTSIVRTADGGRTWAGVPAPRTSLGQPDSGRNGGVSVLRFADAGNGWAGVGELWSTHDGGAHWAKQSLPGAVGVVGHIESGGGHVYALTDGCASQGGNHCEQSVQLYASPIGRDSWTRLATIPAVGGNAGLTVQGADWYVATAQSIRHGSGTSVSGTLPTPCPADGEFRPRVQLAVASRRFLDAVCAGGGAAGSASYQLYGTSDGGAHWARTGPAHREDSGFGGVADNTKGVLLMAVASGRSSILRTTDDGGTLHASLNVGSGGVQWADLGFTTPAQAVVVLLDKALYLSSDAGASWSAVHF